MTDQREALREAIGRERRSLSRLLTRGVIDTSEWSYIAQSFDRLAAAAALPSTPQEGLDEERWYEAVSDALAASTEGTDYAEAPEPSDEPKSPYVLRLTHELLSRLHPAEYARLAPPPPGGSDD